MLALAPMLGINLLILFAVGSAFPLALLILAPWNLVYAQSLRRIVAGDYWAHWRFAPAELEQFAEREAERAVQESRVALWIGLGFSGVFSALFGLLTGSLVVALIALGIGLSAALVPGARMVFGGRAHRARWQRGELDLYISPLGLYLPPANYTPLSGFNQWLSRVELERGPPATLCFEVSVATKLGAEIRQGCACRCRAAGKARLEAVVERFRDSLAGAQGSAGWTRSIPRRPRRDAAARLVSGRTSAL